MDQDALDRGLAEYVQHLEAVSAAFNAHAASMDLPVAMDITSAVAAVRAGIGVADVVRFALRSDDSGIVHESQLKTAIDCTVELLRTPARCGHVVGAMQSGKTTTSLAIQWAGPILYLLTGQRAYPFYLIGNQTNHEDQTKTELERFLAYYGTITIKATNAAVGGLDAVFALSPSLRNYREHILRDAELFYAVPQLDEIVHRRVHGDQSVRRIAEFCKHATERGYRPLMLIDEPQFGASDHIVGPERRKCVLEQMFERIEQALGTTRDDHWFVGLSATPFELNDLSRVWEVRQSLTEAYSGYNYFNGRPISPGVEVKPPVTLGLTQFAASIGVPFVAKISMAAYQGSAASFARHAAKIDFTGDQSDYRAAVDVALRQTILKLLDQYANDPAWPIGLCIRAFNDNDKTEALIGRLGLDPERVEVIKYFGADATNISIKRAIAQRQRHELPYIVFVTNRARMADAFPVRVRFFMDLAQKVSDLNALLQGLLGRACGYNKKSTVVLSDANAAIVDAYVATGGAYVHKTSRHSVAVGGFRRGAPTGMIKLRSDMDDPVVQQFFAEVNREVVEPHLKHGSAKLSVPRAKATDKHRTGPILRIAERLGLFDHIERPAVRANLFPLMLTGFQVARSTDAVRHARKPGVWLRYGLDAAGNCRYTFRWSDRDAKAQGGAQGRAKGKKDSDQHMEPTVYVEKVDIETGEVINDRVVRDRKNKENRGDRKENQPALQPGKWRAFMVTFPLREPVQEKQPADVAYPIETSPYDDLMEPNERQTRDRGLEQQRRSARGARPE